MHRRPSFDASIAFLRAWWQVLLLGVLTTGSYGLAVYSFGVFIEPIHEDTGWSVGSLSASFTLAVLGAGIGAAGSGWMLDRWGGRPVLLGALIVGSVFLFLASTVDTLVLFVVCWAIGGGVVGAGLFYNVTMALTTRLYPGNRIRAFSILTFVGGFAAVIYFPLAGFLVDTLEWRLALRVLVVLLVLHVLPAALFVAGGAAERQPAATSATRKDYAGVFEALRAREVLQMIAMFALAASAFAAIQVLHVPAMTSLGVSLGAATAIASVRGFLSLPGRALMGPVASRFGVAGTLGAVYVLMALGTIPIAIGSQAVLLVLFTVVTGLAFGTISPLHGLLAAEVFGERRIGTLMGVQSLIVSLISASGPLLLGLTVDAAGSYRPAIVIICLLFALSAGMLALRPRDAADGAVELRTLENAQPEQEPGTG